MLPRVIDESAIELLSRFGTVFTRFGADTQDSGNVSYGVRMDDDR